MSRSSNKEASIEEVPPSPSGSNQSEFALAVEGLRTAYMEKRESSTLVPPAGRPVWDMDVAIIDGKVNYTYWYELEDKTPGGGQKLQCIRLVDIPSSVADAILRLERNLPSLSGKPNYEIVGDRVQILTDAPEPSMLDDDSEDVTTELALLPEIAVDPEQHFTKKCKYRSEIHNLLLCQGGVCPGVPKSEYIIPLLGKSAAGELVFERFTSRWVLALLHPLARYKAWILQVINGLACLHSLGIVHRDLRIDNLVFSSDRSHLYIIDLESRWGNHLAPEILWEPTLDAGWNEKSDIYDLGCTIKGMVYGNVPITGVVEWDVPSPLDMIVEACTQSSPEERPSLDVLHNMVAAIEV
ncbi:MAG: hypothetical protein Q9165_001659 [Trypethelium subeluteriae]